MGNYPLTALPVPQATVDVPPFLPVRPALFPVPGTGAAYDTGPAPVSRGLDAVDRHQLGGVKQDTARSDPHEDHEGRAPSSVWQYPENTEDSTAWEIRAGDVQDDRLLGFLWERRRSPAGCSEAAASFEHIFGGQGFNNIEIVCVSRLFVCQRAVCWDLSSSVAEWGSTRDPKTHSAGGGMPNSTNSAPHMLGTMSFKAWSTASENTRPNAEKESYRSDEDDHKPPVASRNNHAAKRSPNMWHDWSDVTDDVASGEGMMPVPSRGLQILPDPGSTTAVDPLGAVQCGSHLPPPSHVLVKGYRYSTKESPQVISDVARRLEAIRVTVSWDALPHVLTHYRTDTPPLRMPAITRHWLDRTVRERLQAFPRITDIEKRWLAFQMICAVAELHSIGVAHGSISTTNFVCSGSDNVFLVDVGSCYKPYLLNVSGNCFSAMTTFFEAPGFHHAAEFPGSRRSCYIAPERFQFRANRCSPSTNEREKTYIGKTMDVGNPPSATAWLEGEHGSPSADTIHFTTVCASDVYSLGCCIAEVFLDGEPAITFPDLMALAGTLRQEEASASGGHVPNFVFPSDAFSECQDVRKSGGPWYLPRRATMIPEKNVMELVSRMCFPDPKARPSAAECLDIARQINVFPDSFFSLLLPLTTLLLHPLLQCPSVASLFLHGTVSRVMLSKNDSSSGPSSDASSDTSSNPLLLSCLMDHSVNSVSLFQAFLETAVDLPWWAKRGPALGGAGKNAILSCTPPAERNADTGGATSPPVTEDTTGCFRAEPDIPSCEATASQHPTTSRRSRESPPGNLRSSFSAPPDMAASWQESPIFARSGTRAATAESVCRVDPADPLDTSSPYPLLYQLMQLWKSRYYYRQTSARRSQASSLFVDSASPDALPPELPFPQLGLASGTSFSSGLVDLWRTGFSKHECCKDARVDTWILEGGHRGFFTYPSPAIQTMARQMCDDLYSRLFNSERELESVQSSGSLEAYPGTTPCERSSWWERPDEALCLFNVVASKLDAPYNTPTTVRHLLHTVALLGQHCLFSPKVLYERVFPLLLSCLKSSRHHPQLSALSLKIVARLLEKCPVDAIPLGYIPDCVFPYLSEIARDPRPRWRSVLLVDLSRILRVIAETFSLAALSAVPVKDLFRPTLLSFFRPMLTSDAPEVRIALLRSSASFPHLFLLKDLTDTVLPFLISFMNSPEPAVRLAFCLHIFALLGTSVDPKSSLGCTLPFESDDYFWAIASALLPCLESALGDSDELVIEGALEGLFQFFRHTATKGTSSTAARGCCFLSLDEHPWRRVACQLAKKIYPLLIHPNVSLASASRRLLKTVENACFSDDQIGAVVHLSQPLLFFYKASFGTAPTPSALLRKGPFLVLPRRTLYSLALASRTASLGVDTPDEMRQRCKELVTPYLKQAFKPSVLDALQRIRSLSRNRKPECLVDGKEYHFSKDHLSDGHGFGYRDRFLAVSDCTPYNSVSSLGSSRQQATARIVRDPSSSYAARPPILPVFARSELNFWSFLFSRPHANLPASAVAETVDDCLLADFSLHQQITTSSPARNTRRGKNGPRQGVFGGARGDVAALAAPWSYRDWRARALKLPFYGPGSTVRIALPSDVDTGQHSEPSFVSEVKLSKDASQQQAGLARGGENRDSNQVSQTSHETRLHCYAGSGNDLNRRLDHIFLNHRNLTKLEKNVGKIHLRVAPSWPSQSSLLHFGQKVPALVQPAVHPKTSCGISESLSPRRAQSPPRHPRVLSSTWRPRGVLLGTIAVHQHELRHSSAASGTTASQYNLGLELTPDHSLLVSGMKGLNIASAGVERPLCPQNSSRSFYVWDCRHMVHDVTHSCVRAIEFTDPFLPTCFRLIGSPTSLLIGTEKGTVATYPLETPRGSATPDYTGAWSSAPKWPFGDHNAETKTVSTTTTSDTGGSDHGGVTALESLETLLEKTACSAHRNGSVGCWDFRCPTISSSFAIPLWMGQPSCMAVAPSQYAIHVGTLGGYLVTIDLRYRLPAQVLRATIAGQPAPILTACAVTTYRQTGVCVTLASQRNELCVLDPITGTIDWGFLSQTVGSPAHKEDPEMLQYTKVVLEHSTVVHWPSNHSGTAHASPPTVQGIPLPQFDIIDASLMYTSRFCRKYRNLEPYLARTEFGGEGNVLALWSSSSGTGSSVSSTAGRFRASESTATPLGGSDPNTLLAGGTDRRVRCLNLAAPVEESYIAIDNESSAANGVMSYSYLPQCQKKRAGYSPSPNVCQKHLARLMFESPYVIERLQPERNSRLRVSPEDSMVSQQHDSLGLQPSKNAGYHRNEPVTLSHSLLTQPSTPAAYHHTHYRVPMASRPDVVNPAHRDAITALTVANWPIPTGCATGYFPCEDSTASAVSDPKRLSSSASILNEPLLITGGRDGVVKIWQ